MKLCGKEYIPSSAFTFAIKNAKTSKTFAMIVTIQEKNIISFPKEGNIWLCSEYKSPLEHEGLVYPSVRHAILSCKTDDIEAKKKIIDTLLPADLKDLERKITPVKKWSVLYVRSLLSFFTLLKFQRHLDLRKKLIETGAKKLLHELRGDQANFEINEISVAANDTGDILMITRELVKEL